MAAAHQCLDLRGMPSWAKPWAAARFLPYALRVVRHRRLTIPTSFHFTDHTQRPLGVSSGALCYPVSRPDALRLAELIVPLEDRRFLKHRGVDGRGVLRALVRNLQATHVVQGGSTITQQLVRNLLINPDRSWTRKILETVLALAVERAYTKEETLCLYCQAVYLGPGVRGFQSASRLIYRRSLERLQPFELCGLVGLLRTPSRTFPRAEPQAFLSRRAFVAQRIREAGAEISSSPPPVVLNPLRAEGLARPRWTACAIELLRAAGVETSDIRSVILTIDRSLQGRVDRILAPVSRSAEVAEVAAVVIDNASGDILAESAWQGGEEAHISPAFAPGLQPGSTYKTFALLAALEQGLSSQTLFESAPFTSTTIANAQGVPWSVRNYAHVYRTQMTLEDGLRFSDNTVFARLAEYLSLRILEETYRRFGLVRTARPTPAITLGAVHGGVSLLQVVLAYAAIAWGGVRVTPRLLRVVEYRDGTYWQPLRPPGDLLVKSPEVLAELRRILHKTLPVSDARGLAGKTGTTRTASMVAAYNAGRSLGLWIRHKLPQREGDAKTLSAIALLERFVAEEVLGHRQDVFNI